MAARSSDIGESSVDARRAGFSGPSSRPLSRFPCRAAGRQQPSTCRRLAARVWYVIHPPSISGYALDVRRQSSVKAASLLLARWHYTPGIVGVFSPRASEPACRVVRPSGLPRSLAYEEIRSAFWSLTVDDRLLEVVTIPSGASGRRAFWLSRHRHPRVAREKRMLYWWRSGPNGPRDALADMDE